MSRHSTFDDAVGESAVRKVRTRILPLIFVMYFLSYLDRVNVSFAALSMNKDLGFTATVFGWGVGLFFVGYLLAEVPSNLCLEKVGARRWLARIMVTWGLISASMCLVSGPLSFYITRFLLGLAEAGLFPGVMLYLTYWFPAQTRSRTVALFLTSAPLSTIFGAPLSGALLGLDGLFGLTGWQWMFILEGLPTVIFGIIVFFVLPDSPVKARWLNSGERAWLARELAAEDVLRRSFNRSSALQALLSGRVAVLCAAYLLMLTALYGIGFWSPQMVKAFGFGNLQVGFLVAIPAVVTAPAMVIWSLRSDRLNERLWHAVIPLLLAACGLILAAEAKTIGVVMLGLTIASVGIWSALSPFWEIPIGQLSGTAAAAGIALIGAVGNMGGYVGPLALGVIRDTTGGFEVGLLLLAASAALACPIIWTVCRSSRGREHSPEELGGLPVGRSSGIGEAR